MKTGRDIGDVEDEEPGWSSKTGKIEQDDPRPAKAAPRKRRARNDDPPEGLDPSRLKGARKAKLPDFVEPQLATLKPHPPSGARWLHEIKFDGYRLQAHLADGKARLTDAQRARLERPLRQGGARRALRALVPARRSSTANWWSRRRAAPRIFPPCRPISARSARTASSFYLFDLMFLNGYDLRNVALERRKAMLKTLLAGAPTVLRFSEHFEEDGELILRHACRLSLEGVVSKLRDGIYKSGRGRDWIKSKCSARQEFVVAGYVPSTTSSKAIGSLVLGQYEKARSLFMPAGSAPAFRARSQKISTSDWKS